LAQLGEQELERPPQAAAAPAPAAAPAVPTVAPAAPARSRTKRAVDIVLVLAVSPLVIPLGLIVGIAVALTSRGAVLFGQERVGLGGTTFKMYKFRTMHREAEQLLQRDPRLWNEYVTNGFKLPAELDRRVTRVGRFLRRSSLDELPQVLNVLLGNMSVVGPRPVVPAEIANYGDKQAAYLSVRPGITGAWQVTGRSNVDYPQRVEFDAQYVETWSLGLDLKILAKTPRAVLSARGAF
jgi:lipopolysaccharide/colanic/teichoic acid biosynthesis glycosyltransferase